MYMRMKYKYYHGYSKAKKLLDDDPVLPGCRHEHPRRMLKQQFQAGDISRSVYDVLRRETLFQRSSRNRTGEAPPVVRMILHHGDLVVMHGEALQKYYEHSVVPEKKLRFALTARYIKPDQVDEKDLAKGQCLLMPDQVYDGR